MNTANRTVLITGGAGGIGFALAEAFLQRGSRVKICDRNRESLERAKGLHPELDVFPCDLADKAQREKLYEWATADGALDTLLNNAGIQKNFDFTKSLADGADAGENEIEIDLIAPIHLCRLFAPYLAKKADAAILNISSSLAVVPDAKTPVYCACKAGMHAVTRCLREQLAPSGVKVFELLPPAVESGLNPEGRAADPIPIPLTPPAEYAAYVMAALEADRYEIYSVLTEGLLDKTSREMYEYFKDSGNPR